MLLCDCLGVLLFCSKIADFPHTGLFLCNKHNALHFFAVLCFSFWENTGRKTYLHLLLSFVQTENKRNRLSSLFHENYITLRHNCVLKQGKQNIILGCWDGQIKLVQSFLLKSNFFVASWKSSHGHKYTSVLEIVFGSYQHIVIG